MKVAKKEERRGCITTMLLLSSALQEKNKETEISHFLFPSLPRAFL
jgi:hypothetical protein